MADLSDPTRFKVEPELRSRDKTFRDYLMDIFRGVGAGNYAAGKLAKSTENTADFVPWLGQGLAANRARNEFYKGNYSKAALESLGALPGFVAPRQIQKGMSAIKAQEKGRPTGTFLMTRDEKPFGMVTASKADIDHPLYSGPAQEGRGVVDVTVGPFTDQSSIQKALAERRISPERADDIARSPHTPMESTDILRLGGLEPIDAVEAGITPGELTTPEMRRILATISRDPSLKNVNAATFSRVSGSQVGPAARETVGRSGSGITSVDALRKFAKRSGIGRPKVVNLPEIFPRGPKTGVKDIPDVLVERAQDKGFSVRTAHQKARDRNRPSDRNEFDDFFNDEADRQLAEQDQIDIPF